MRSTIFSSLCTPRSSATASSAFLVMRFAFSLLRFWYVQMEVRAPAQLGEGVKLAAFLVDAVHANDAFLDHFV
jgi:hypothetical protein